MFNEHDVYQTVHHECKEHKQTINRQTDNTNTTDFNIFPQKVNQHICDLQASC